MEAINSNEIRIELYKEREFNLTGSLAYNDRLKIIYCDDYTNIQIPQLASQRLLEQSEQYDILGYMEDDILIEDYDFFIKLDICTKFCLRNIQLCRTDVSI